MSQYLSQTMGQQMRMEQRLTPQMIQAMDILQLGMMDLENRVEEELEKNVTLETNEQDQNTPPEPETPDTPEDTSETEGFDYLDTLEQEYGAGLADSFFESSYSPGRGGQSGERDAKMEAMANTAARGGSLSEHLHEQWRILEISDQLRAAGETLIDFLEEDGYLRNRLEEVAESQRPPLDLEILEEALLLIQHMDPTGCGARDWQECLLLQVEELPGDNSIERVLIKNHLSDLEKNRFPAIMKATGFSLGEIQEALKVIRTHLTLHPGYLVSDRPVPRITPDVIVDYSERTGKLEVQLGDGNTPRLQVSRKYIEMLRQKEESKEVRDFVRKHVESANALIDAIRFRRDRLYDVAQAIIERQKEFFDVGPKGLKVLRMSELAEQFGCDPSTISRTVAEKYMQTPRGIFPLRYFFIGGPPQNHSDGDTSWDSVKERVREIIDNEDKGKPLNDDAIAEMLQGEGVTISRRTIAKYRQQLNIPPRHKRREYS